MKSTASPTMTKNEQKGIEIDHRDNLSYKEFFHEYLMPRKPVVITDATAKWKARSWTPEWFRNRYPGMKVQTDQGEMVMEEFIDAITAQSDEPGPFLREQLLKDVFPDIIDHVLPASMYMLPNWLGGNYILDRVNKRLHRESTIEVNFCGRRIFPYLHFDDLHVHAFISQLYGEKAVVLFPPDQEQFIYRKGEHRVSEIPDVDNVDLNQFPLFAKATPIRVVLKPGESFFMPCGWWHTTRVPGASLSTVSSFVNSSNWSELVDDIEKELSHRPTFASLYGAYMRSTGFFKSLVN
ncbi:MAG: cupin-like domain-containing protein [Bacteroidota bacterium]